MSGVVGPLSSRYDVKMAWIETVSDDNAEGLLASLYKAAIKRAGKVYNIVRLQSANPPVLRSSMAIYRDIMFGDSPLSRGQRELIAVVVSRANDCHY